MAIGRNSGGRGNGSGGGYWTRTGTALKNTLPGTVTIQGEGADANKALQIKNAVGVVVGYINNGGHMELTGLLHALAIVMYPDSGKITDGGGTWHLKSKSLGMAEFFGLLNDYYDLSDYYDDLSHVNWGAVKRRNGKKELSFTLNQVGVNPPTVINFLNNTVTDATFLMQYDAVGDYSGARDGGDNSYFNEFSFPQPGSGIKKVDLCDDNGAAVGYFFYYTTGNDSFRVKCFDQFGAPTDDLLKPNIVLTFDLYNQ